MSKASRKQITNPVIVADNSSRMLLAGIICLVVGLAVGYYFGQQSVESQAVVQRPAQDPVPAGNNSAFLQEETSLRSALLINPKDLDANIQLGNLYYDHNQFSQAIEYYGRALEIDPRNPNVRTDRGTSYWRLDQPDAAIGEFKKSLEVDPSHAQTLYNLGIVYLDGKNNHEEARNAWERLLATNPNYPDRAKVEKQISSLQTTGSTSGGSKKEPSADIQDLLKRMKNK
jgi:tetratricopeptide (TPR) repeat protein